MMRNIRPPAQASGETLRACGAGCSVNLQFVDREIYSQANENIRKIFLLQPDVFIGRALGVLPHNPAILERGGKV